MRLGKLRQLGLGTDLLCFSACRLPPCCVAACLSVIATSCGLFQPTPPPKAKPVLYEWRDDNGPGEMGVEIDLAKQIAIYRRSGRLVGWSFVSTASFLTGDCADFPILPSSPPH